MLLLEQALLVESLQIDKCIGRFIRVVVVSLVVCGQGCELPNRLLEVVLAELDRFFQIVDLVCFVITFLHSLVTSELI